MENVYSVKTFSSLTADMLMFEQRRDSDNFIPCDLLHRKIPLLQHVYTVTQGKITYTDLMRREIDAPEDADVKLYFEEAPI